jgi:hypothetical protein
MSGSSGDDASDGNRHRGQTETLGGISFRQVWQIIKTHCQDTCALNKVSANQRKRRARGLIEAVLTNPWERQINPAV